MTDKEVIEYCNLNKHKKWSNRNKDIITYLLNKYNDFSVDDIYDKCRESLYRLKHNINSIPRCNNCGMQLKYSIRFKFYHSACCDQCMKILKTKKFHNTSLLLYGTNTPSQAKIVKEKQKITNINKYGNISPLCNKKIKEKTKKTLLSRYNVDNISKSNQWKEHVNKTSLDKYGTLYPNQSIIVKEKIKQTLIDHYGVDCYYKSKECKLKANSKEAIDKGIESKRKNNTLNKSKIENESYNILKKKYPDIKKQYKSKLYPYHCDFYVPILDLYIECNYHWTHGGHPFDKNSYGDLTILNIWKNKKLHYYDNAIITWTIRDVNKRNIAKENKLNYKEIWSIEELYNI